MGAGSSTEAEREPLLVPSHGEANSPPVNSRVYGRRWLVLTLFSLLGLMQGMVWNFWGPIQNSAAHAFGFTKSDIAVLVLWGPVGFVPWLLFMWLLDKKGLRVSLLLSAFFMLLGSALRSIPLTDQSLRRWFIHGGQLLNGLAGPTIMSAGPFLSTTWFGPDQRATATAVASLFSYLGGAASFVIGPLVVPAPNETLAGPATAAEGLDNSIRDMIQLVMYAGTGSTGEPPRARKIDSTSFQHHVSPSRDTNTIRRRGSKNFCASTKKKPNYSLHNHTAGEKKRLLGLLCLTDSEN